MALPIENLSVITFDSLLSQGRESARVEYIDVTFKKTALPSIHSLVLVVAVPTYKYRYHQY